MSADNWTICPKCDQERLENIKAMEKKVHDSYGKVSESEYGHLKAEMAKLKDQKEQEYTFREDYEVGIYDNEFTVYYRGSCRTCDFEYSYDYAEQIKI